MVSSMSAAGTRETDPADAVLPHHSGRGPTRNSDSDADLGGVCWDHPMAGIVKQQSRQ